MARDLRGSGLRVVVLESGGLKPDPRTQALYRGAIVGKEYAPLDAARLRFFGGTTNHWNGRCRPLDPIDLEVREGVPGSGWPISYEELLRWYPGAQEICQLGPFTYSPEDWSELGRLLPLDASRVITKIFQLSPPTRFGEVYLEDLADAENVEVYLRANVVDIEPVARPKVRVATLAGTSFTASSSALVLCCGGVENARLLLSGRGGQGIGGDAVGRYFMEHLHFNNPTVLVPSDQEALELYLPRGKDSGSARSALVIANDVVRREGLLRFSGVLAPNLERTEADFSRMSSVVRSVHRRETSPVALVVEAEQSPNPDSRVRLTRHRDALGVPRVALDWRLRKRDLRSIRESLAIVGEALGAAGVGRLHTGIADPPPQTGGVFHHMGTTRMGTDRSTSVVDPDGLVHETDAIYVAGSSTFPTGGFANPTLTIVALSLRLSRHLRRKLGANA